MRLKLMASSVVLLASAFTAQAADLPSKKAPVMAPVAVSPWDFAVGGGLTTDYIFRGISQSNRSFSVNASGELRYNFNDTWQAYAGVAGESIKLTAVDTGPNMELDVFGGLRGTWGAFSADLGAIGYLYPGVSTPTPNLIFPTNPSYVEVYGKGAYNLTDWLSIGANVFYSPNFLDFGTSGTYVSGTAKATWGDFSISGEVGHQFLGTTDLTHGLIKLPDYTYYNVGASYAYKFVTLDLRFHDTSLSKTSCAMITGPSSFSTPTQSKYCSATVVGTISFALTGKDLK
jgi:uncharacterized protein (TIGR02001 family)